MFRPQFMSTVIFIIILCGRVDADLGEMRSKSKLMKRIYIVYLNNCSFFVYSLFFYGFGR